MLLFSRNPLILLLCIFLFGCESKKTYDIDSDKVVADLSERINSLQEDLTTLNKELEEVKVVLKDKDIDTVLRKNIRKEIHEGKKYQKLIQQHIDYLKIRRKKRYQSLLDRKKSPELIEQAEQETKAYFMNKKLKPIERPWKDRYKTAIEL